MPWVNSYVEDKCRIALPFQKKIDLELQGTNLFDTRIYNNIMTSSFILISQQIQMRPRQVLLRVNFSF
jgi:outer membrane receptor for monomeric catechols